MDNVSFVDFEQNGETVTHAIIEHADGGFTSMLKSTYDAQQAEQSTPNLAVDEAKTK
jgi:hypothetical protein